MSLLSLLDEECLRMGHASDDSFVSKLGQVYHDSPLLEITTGPAAKCGEPSALNAFRYANGTVALPARNWAIELRAGDVLPNPVL